MPEVADGAFTNGHEILRHGLFAQVAPEHCHVRRAVLAGLSGASVKGFAPDARTSAERAVRRARERPIDLFADLCLPVATEGWAAFAGYGASDAARLGDDVERFSRQLSFDPHPADAQEADLAAASLLERTRTVIDGGHACLARQIADAVGQPSGTPLVASLLFDAIDTAAAGLAGMLAVLLHEEADRSALSDPSYRELAIEEALRLATPTPFTVRQASEAVVIGDQPVAKDALIWMWWSAGNRDPDAFPEPERFRPGRSERGLPFGIGAHSCVGYGWTKQLAHLLVDLAFDRKRPLTVVSTEWRWAIGGARRPTGLTVVQA